MSPDSYTHMIASIPRFPDDWSNEILTQRYDWNYQLSNYTNLPVLCTYG